MKDNRPARQELGECTCIAILLFNLLVLPGVLAALLWKSRDQYRFPWLLKAGFTGVFLIYLLIIGRWDFVSIYVRWVWVVLFAAALIASYRVVRDKPLFAPGGLRKNLLLSAVNLVILVFFSLFLFLAARGWVYPDQAAHVQFPLRSGSYYVAHGGSSPLINAHNVSKSQRYALDIVALNPLGLRAGGLLPADNARYVIFDQPVTAPCAGQVTAAVDGLPDLTPPQMDPGNPAGNHVVIDCPEAVLLLAHLRSGSVLVRAGETVTAGQPVGRVGNSGNTTEPHLHIHAVRPGSGSPFDGEGMPVVFDGRFLVRNQIVKFSDK